MLFGLTNGSATYQRVLDQMFKGEQRKCVVSFLDYTIILSESLEKHMKHLDIVFLTIKACGMDLNFK